VLRDLISSGQVPTVFLNQIFRQGENSLIVLNAHRINAGDMPMRGTAEGDFFFIGENDPDKIAEQVFSLCATRLPRHYGFDPVRDVQVISPMYRGTAGVTNLNAGLQERINPQPADAPAVKLSNGQGRVGDKVMQMRNNYDKGVFNGDMGIISAIDSEDDKLWVRLLGAASSDVEYDHDEAGELALAYACSVHKSQGSEFPAVVLPLTTQHFVMLQRNLLYTAVTRARRLVVLVGAPRALALAVKNDRVEQRWTRLAARLKHLAETSEPPPLREPVLFD
jgi:exodeoxyribonuclease V alpha subunit